MAGAFPLPLHHALDLAVRAHLPLALAAEHALASEDSPAAMAVLQRNGALRTCRQRARAAAGLDDASDCDGCTWDAPDPGIDGDAS